MTPREILPPILYPSETTGLPTETIEVGDSPGLAQGERIYLEVDSPTIALGADWDFGGELKNSEGFVVSFKSIIIQQVEIDSPLPENDTLTLLVFRNSLRRSPRDLLSRYSGDSQISGVWKSVFSDQLIEYFDSTGDGKLYGRLTNAAGNTQSATAHIVITARKVS